MDKDYSFQRVYQSLNISAKIKSQADDFIVEENMDIEFSGDGEHCWIYIKKRECNTDWVAQQLAKYCGVKKLAVAYAGLKDRHALTSQWFSVQLPGKPTPDWAEFESSFSTPESDESVRVLQCFRHNRKLQRGALKSNTFKITLRELSDTSEKCFDLLTQRCDEIAGNGVPNYFGPQRFGRAYNNLEQATKLFSNPRYKLAKHKRGLYLSAARSWLFNSILSERINNKVWNSRLPGDVYMLDGKSACFKDELNSDAVDELNQRLERNEIHPTAILWGEGDVMVALQAAEMEAEIIDQFPVYRDGLIAARLKSQRRACRIIPRHVECSRLEHDFEVSFTLPAGSYATMVLAEIFSDLH
jgi:tRNA pseudouridine13 synthase